MSLAGQALLWGKSSSQQGAAPGHSLPHHISSTSDFHVLPGLARSHTAYSCPHPIPRLPPLPGRRARNWSRRVGPPPPPGAKHPGSQQRCPQGTQQVPARTEGEPDLILGAGKGPDLITAACTQHGQEPGSLGTLAPWISQPHQAGRVGQAPRDEARWKGLSSSCFAPSSWQ